MKVVANAGSLIALGKLGMIHLLHHLYGSVLIPSAVYEEAAARSLEFEPDDAQAIRLAIARNEIVVVAVEDTHLSETVRTSVLHRGEEHAIHLALVEAADCLLLDDLLAREHAQRLGLKVKGTLGVIATAYHSGFLRFQEVELILQAILDRDDIWIHDTLVRRIWDQLRQEESAR